MVVIDCSCFVVIDLRLLDLTILNVRALIEEKNFFSLLIQLWQEKSEVDAAAALLHVRCLTEISPGHSACLRLVQMFITMSVYSEGFLHNFSFISVFSEACTTHTCVS